MLAFVSKNAGNQPTESKEFDDAVLHIVVKTLEVCFYSWQYHRYVADLIAVPVGGLQEVDGLPCYSHDLVACEWSCELCLKAHGLRRSVHAWSFVWSGLLWLLVVAALLVHELVFGAWWR